MKIKFEDCTDYDTGVKYLVQEFGEDWFNKIDIRILNMCSIYKSIIGQLSEKGYEDYVEKLGLSFWECCDNGSNVFSSYYKQLSWEKHQENWKRIIDSKQTHYASENVLSVNGKTLGTVSNLELQPQKYLLSHNKNQRFLLTFADKSCMILTSLKDAPEGQKFTYEVI